MNEVMTVKQLKKSNFIIFESIVGSTLFNLNIKNSDIDICGVYKLPKKHLLKIGALDPSKISSFGSGEVSSKNEDIKYFELTKFFNLALKCNPNIIELLYIPVKFVNICAPDMEKIIKNKDLFLNQKIFNSYIGYAEAQIEKAKGQNKLINNPEKKEQPIKEDFCWVILNEQYATHKNLTYDHYKKAPFRPVPIKEVGLDLSMFHVASLEHVSNTYRLYWYGPNKSKGVFRGDDMLVTESIPLQDEWDKCCGLLIYNKQGYEKSFNKWKKYWNWTKVRNKNRWLNQENKKVDYDCKNMMHCMRLLYSGINFLQFNEPIIRFHGKQRQFLLDIRNGKYSFDYLLKTVEEQKLKFRESEKSTTIPEKIDLKKINNLYQELMEV